MKVVITITVGEGQIVLSIAASLGEFLASLGRVLSKFERVLWRVILERRVLGKLGGVCFFRGNIKLNKIAIPLDVPT